MNRWIYALCIWLGVWVLPAQAALNVFACEPEWGALVRELANPEDVSVFVATTASQDPHFIEARPSLLARMRQADLVVCTGLELEQGWLPILLQRAGKAPVQPGQAGYFEAGAQVTRLEVPSRLERSDGDVHAGGNPHIQQDPRLILQIAQALSARLQLLDASRKPVYQQRLQGFSQRWQQAMQRWQQQAAPLKGMRVVSHHRDMSYLAAWLGLEVVATLEEKPGLEPTVGHLNRLLARLRQQPARLILHTPYQNPRAAHWLAAQTGMPIVEMPFTVGEMAPDLFAVFDLSLQRLLKAAS